MKRRLGGRLRTSAPTSSSPAPYPSLPPERRKLAHFAASPLPNKAFGFAGGPIGFVAHTMQGPGVIGAARRRARRPGAPQKPPHPSSPTAMPPSPLCGEGFGGASYRLPPSGGKLSSEVRLMRGQITGPRADEDIRPYGIPQTLRTVGQGLCPCQFAGGHTGPPLRGS